MKNNVLWLILSCLMVVALVLASCAPAKPTAPTTPTTPTTPTIPTTPATPTAPTKPVTGVKPTYGGTITVTETSYIQFDPGYRYEATAARTGSFVLEKLVIADWIVDRNLWSFFSPSGTLPPIQYCRGQLLESWETPDPLTIILHVRQGVHFHDKPPVNGREFTADDVIWNIERLKKSPFADHTQLDYIASMNKKDKWTVELRLTPPPMVGLVRAIFNQGCLVFWPKEIMGKSGEIEDWRNIVGTGPFMIEDYVPDSAVTFRRNPSYWGFDEKHPENRLPYADFAKVLLIPEKSTQYAGVRTGKIDFVWEVLWRDADALLKTAPHLLSRGVPTSSPRYFKPRWDTPPFNDVRVRQALNMAIDHNEIVKSIYGSHASYYIALLSELTGLYTPYEKLPDKPMWTTVSCKEVLSYNPKKAKELLAAAGYPNGFKTHVDTCLVHDPTGITEPLQSYLAKISIEAQINVYELAAFNALRLGKKHTQIILHWATNNPDPFYQLTWFVDPGHQYNLGVVNDPYFQNLYYKARSEFGDAKREKMLLEMEYYAIENAFNINFPHYQDMFIWQPWLGGYAGEGGLAMVHTGAVWARVWVDQELKKSLGF